MSNSLLEVSMPNTPAYLIYICEKFDFRELNPTREHKYLQAYNETKMKYKLSLVILFMIV